MLISDVGSNGYLPVYPGHDDLTGTLYSTPLKTTEGIIGVFNIHKSIPGFISESEMVLFNATADHITSAIANSRLFHEVRRQAVLDKLTGLYSRRYFMEGMQKELSKARRQQTPISIAMIDIDDFKKVNDIHGHLIGDMVLKELGNIIWANTRQGDIAACYGGEEFAIILSGADLVQAAYIAEKLHSVIEEELSMDRPCGQINITISGGVASFPDQGESTEDLLGVADEYLLKAKSSGKNLILYNKPNGNGNGNGRTITVSEKRISPRFALRLRFSKTDKGVIALNIREGGEWRIMALEDVSKTGLRAVVSFDPEEGESYYCQAVLESGVESQHFFSVACARKGMTRDGRYMLGAKVVNNVGS